MNIPETEVFKLQDYAKMYWLKDYQLGSTLDFRLDLKGFYSLKHTRQPNTCQLFLIDLPLTISAKFIFITHPILGKKYNANLMTCHTRRGQSVVSHLLWCLGIVFISCKGSVALASFRQIRWEAWQTLFRLKSSFTVCPSRIGLALAS